MRKVRFSVFVNDRDGWGKYQTEILAWPNTSGVLLAIRENDALTRAGRAGHVTAIKRTRKCRSCKRVLALDVWDGRVCATCIARGVRAELPAPDPEPERVSVMLEVLPKEACTVKLPRSMRGCEYDPGEDMLDPIRDYFCVPHKNEPIPGRPAKIDLLFRERVVPKGTLPANPWDRKPRDAGRQDHLDPTMQEAARNVGDFGPRVDDSQAGKPW